MAVSSTYFFLLVSRLMSSLRSLWSLSGLMALVSTLDRLTSKKKYVDETAKHQAVIKYFREEAYPKLKTLLEDELAELEEVVQQGTVFAALSQVE